MNEKAGMKKSKRNERNYVNYAPISLLNLEQRSSQDLNFDATDLPTQSMDLSQMTANRYYTD